MLPLAGARGHSEALLITVIFAPAGMSSSGPSEIRGDNRYCAAKQICTATNKDVTGRSREAERFQRGWGGVVTAGELSCDVVPTPCSCAGLTNSK
jgi:hypothetical protein